MKGSGDSMTPIIRSGDKLVLEISPECVYEAGDIVSYIDYWGNTVSHRVLSVSKTYSGHRQYLIKGDHNNQSEFNIDQNRVFGKVVRIKYRSGGINLMTRASRIVAQSIAWCGRRTTSHRKFFIFERIITHSLVGLLSIWNKCVSIFTLSSV